jgi:hypothetical protein
VSTKPATVIDGLAGALSLAAAHDGAVEMAPCCVLWPDEGREWEPAIPLLRERRWVLTLGSFDPSTAMGPAIWIRAQVDKATEDIPIVYLPGISRSALRSPTEMPPSLLPLLELQYRGSVFAHRNGRDWTILAFLAASDRGGLAIPIADDAATRKALLAAREQLFRQPVDRLRAEAPLRASFFHELLAPDVIADVLAWINDEAGFQASRDEDARRAFAERVKARLRFDVAEGTIAAARMLGDASDDGWRQAWTRFEQAPSAFPGIEGRLRAARPRKSSGGGLLFDRPGTWPQDNDEEEDRLRAALAELKDVPASPARDRVLALEAEHGSRRTWVWARLGRSPLANAMEHLARVADRTKYLPAGTLAEQVEAYVGGAWETDGSVLDALSTVSTAADRAAVESAVQAMYRDWLEASAKQFQAAAGGTYGPDAMPEWPESTCLIFLDGMRFDVGQWLAIRLAGVADVEVRPHLAALPTITPTSKPAVSPAATAVVPSEGLGPSATGSAAELTATSLRKLIEGAGWQLLGSADTGDPSGRAWVEMGDLDELGHKQAPKFADHIGRELDYVVERVGQLLAAGWSQVAVVTDHGWLYLPGGLPKVQIPASIAGSGHRKGRCARLKPMADHDGIRMPWHWNPKVEFAMAPDIACFEAGKIYEHGGLSLQECVTPIVVARRRDQATGTLSLDLRWRGLWAEVSVSGAQAVTVDVRTKAGDPASSVLLDGPIALDESGAGRGVADDRFLEVAAFAVVVDASGAVLAQQQTVTGGE